MSDERDPANLKRHPLNEDIYGALTLEPDFVESVERQGVLEPVLIKPDGTIVSGHRRVEAACEVGLDEVLVRVVEFESELAEREALVHHNKQRTKTFSQKMREAMELEKIERKRAKERQGRRADIKQTFAASEYGQTREKVATNLDMSHETYRKAKRVWEAAQDGVDRMQRQVEKLDAGEQSIHGAYQELQRWEELRELENPIEWEPFAEAQSGTIEQDFETVLDRHGDEAGEESDWMSAVGALYNSWKDEFDVTNLAGQSYQGSANVFAYMLEKEGQVTLGGGNIDEGELEPESFVDRKPDSDTLRRLYWEEEHSPQQIGLSVGVHERLVYYWFWEEGIPLRAEEVSEQVRERIEELQGIEEE